MEKSSRGHLAQFPVQTSTSFKVDPEEWYEGQNQESLLLESPPETGLVYNLILLNTHISKFKYKHKQEDLNMEYI